MAAVLLIMFVLVAAVFGVSFAVCATLTGAKKAREKGDALGSKRER